MPQRDALESSFTVQLGQRLRKRMGSVEVGVAIGADHEHAHTRQLTGQVLLLRGVPTTDELTAIADVRRYLADEELSAMEIDARFLGSTSTRRVIVRGEAS